ERIIMKIDDEDTLPTIEKYSINIAIEERKISNNITEIKNLEKEINNCQCIGLKEKLFEITERCSRYIKEIKTELDEFENLIGIFQNYLDDLLSLASEIKKELYATKLFYEILKENPKVFGALNKVNYELKDLFDKKIDDFELSKEITEEEQEKLFDDLDLDEIKETFKFISEKKIKRKRTGTGLYKSMISVKDNAQKTIVASKNYLKYKIKKMKKAQRMAKFTGKNDYKDT
ncbi:MAG: hypothetical protein MJ252_20465, partial [archaeon]|nr:hypothetical protein [archaeon]